ncbi:hypothetical protein PL8927_720311 [Planktothrix serta PCC 8927]|uniref:Uncharacterized protein n=1 Tax=Planktothrix serta PCC 8927 TaxID=671068 RepID=A0A7Z9BV19_9CYAN|nr:hypothetical protein PL8927_720311 [Planktothrix serta PCC 8927]
MYSNCQVTTSILILIGVEQVGLNQCKVLLGKLVSVILNGALAQYDNRKDSKTCSCHSECSVSEMKNLSNTNLQETNISKILRFTLLHLV